MWRRVWYGLVFIGTFLVLDLRLYYLWSRFGRMLFEGLFVDKAIKEYRDEEELQQAMEKWVWRRDPLWELGDMISCPARVEYLATAGQPVGDCDDFSIYCGTALAALEKKNGTIAGKIVKEISLLTVPWMEKSGKVNGHNVCVFRYLSPGGGWYWAWVSNWYDCKIQWTNPSGHFFETPAQIAAHMCISADSDNIRWARVTLDLRHVLETGTAG
jgi:hypothetical protein